MTKLPSCFEHAIMQDHPHAKKIMKYVNEAWELLKDKGISTPHTIRLTMARDAWGSYVRKMQED